MVNHENYFRARGSRRCNGNFRFGDLRLKKKIEKESKSIFNQNTYR